MEIIGKCIAILDAEKFVSKKNGNEYVRHSFVIETQGSYPKKICFSVMGDDKWGKFAIVVGNSYSVSFDIESREWNGRWFTECGAWKVVSVEEQKPQAQANVQAQKPIEPEPIQPTNSSQSDMPF